MFASAGLVARFDRKQALKLAAEIAEYLSAREIKVHIEKTLEQKLQTAAEPISLENMNTDLIITIGGDGTILRACASIPKPEPPILAINMGVRGFLTEVEPKLAFKAIDRCLKGDYRIEKCMKLASTASGVKLPDALNEIVITHDEPAKIIYTRILKNSKPILDCQADTLLVSTQTGSTGYSLSAGGPVLDPSVEAYVLTPICPLTDFRPIVFPAKSSLAIEVLRPKKMLVLVDGQHHPLPSSTDPAVTITSSKEVTSFIRFKEDYYNRLRSRLLFRGTR